MMPALFTRLSTRPKKTDVRPDTTKTDKERAQARRAQVRRAQIQHRQRKANYIKQLELDVSQLRDLVTVTEKETTQLAVENAKIREMIIAAGFTGATDAQPELFSGIDVDDLTVTLSMDEKMGTPCFQISSQSASGSSAGGSSAVGPVQLTPAQEQRAINFILAYVYRPSPRALRIC